MIDIKIIQPKADDQFKTIWTELVRLQSEYFSLNDKYAQVLPSPKEIPLDGEAYPINLRQPEKDQKKSIGAFIFTEDIVFQTTVNVFEGEDKGFVMIARFQVGEKIYSRSRSSQNEDSGWYEEIIEKI